MPVEGHHSSADTLVRGPKIPSIRCLRPPVRGHHSPARLLGQAHRFNGLSHAANLVDLRNTKAHTEKEGHGARELRVLGRSAPGRPAASEAHNRAMPGAGASMRCERQPPGLFLFVP